MLELAPQTSGSVRGRAAYKALAPMRPMAPPALCNVLSLLSPPRHFHRLQELRSHDEASPSAFFIMEGWAASSIVKNNGELCMISLYFPGDIVGLPQVITPRCAEINFAVSPVSAVRLCGREIEDIFENLAYNKFLAAIMHREREILVDRLVACSQGDSASKLAQFFIELVSRSAVKPVTNRIQMQTPLRQSDIADFVSMTNVHVNRTLRGPRMRELVALRGGLIDISDVAQLSSMAGRHRMHKFLRSE